MDMPLSADAPLVSPVDVRVDSLGAPLLLRPACEPAVPLVFASPHSGAAYPAEFLAAARLDRLGLRRSEDSFVDELFAAAPGWGAPLLAATFPRAWCDANREAWELDPTMFEDALPAWVNSASPRVGAGLGTIARVVASGAPIYRRKLRFAEAEQRVHQCWEPYHGALAQLVEETRARFGVCLLVDCHSMPMVSLARGPDFVLGDAHGASCAPRITRFVEQALQGQGYRVARNDPYAGGYTTRHYGRPRQGVHALQIELGRGLYMDETRMEKNAGFAAIQAALGELIQALASASPSLLPAP